MLTDIIKNPIDTPYGYKNSDFGIALRGPLSQFFCVFRQDRSMIPLQTDQ